MVAIALRLAAMKINIALEINIYSSSPTDRGEGTSDFKTLSEFYQYGQLYLKVTLQFKLADQLVGFSTQGIQKEREKIFTWQWRNREEKERPEENIEQVKRQVEVIREIKIGRRSFNKLSAFNKMP